MSFSEAQGAAGEPAQRAAGEPAQEERGADEQHLPILLFDGHCGFCSAAVDWLEPRLQRRTCLLPFQETGDEQLSALGLGETDVQRTAWWIEPDGSRFHSAQAVARALIACRGIWRRLGLVLLAPGMRLVGTALYRVVARVRNRLPGATPICSRPGPHVRIVGAGA